jgi:hypothetical protein
MRTFLHHVAHTTHTRPPLAMTALSPPDALAGTTQGNPLRCFSRTPRQDRQKTPLPAGQKGLCSKSIPALAEKAQNLYNGVQKKDSSLDMT